MCCLTICLFNTGNQEHFTNFQTLLWWKFVEMTWYKPTVRVNESRFYVSSQLNFSQRTRQLRWPDVIQFQCLMLEFQLQPVRKSLVLPRLTLRSLSPNPPCPLNEDLRSSALAIALQHIRRDWVCLRNLWPGYDEKRISVTNKIFGLISYKDTTRFFVAAQPWCFRDQIWWLKNKMP